MKQSVSEIDFSELQKEWPHRSRAFSASRDYSEIKENDMKRLSVSYMKQEL